MHKESETKTRPKIVQGVQQQHVYPCPWKIEKYCVVV